MQKAILEKLIRVLFLRLVGKPTMVQEIRMTFYRVIILNFFWIEGNLPRSLEQKFEFFANTSWELSPKPRNSMGLRYLSEEMLMYLCANLKRPAWVDYPKVLKIKMSLNDVVKQWPLMFDLTNTKPG
jgi:hypothetical protein